MEATLTQLTAKQGIIKSQLNKLISFITNFKKDEEDLGQIRVRTSRLDKLYEDYSNLQTEIEILDTKNAKKHEKDRDSVDKQYFEALGLIDVLLNPNQKSSKSTAIDSNTMSSDIITSQNRQTKVQLPIIELPTFKGSFSGWTTFYDSFKSLIHENDSLSEIEKFHYLKSCVRDDAAKTIDSLALSNDNYKIAFETLQKRYNNKRLIVQEHVYSLINLTPLTRPCHSNLQTLMNDITVNIAALKALKLPVDQWDAILVPILLAKLDFTTKREFESTLNTEIAKLDDFLIFLGKRCQLLESLEAMNKIAIKSDTRSQTVNSNNSNKQYIKRSTTLHGTHNNHKFNKKCQFCKNAHAIYQCEKFIAQTITERFDVVKQLKLCSNCLRSNHTLQYCKSNIKCRHCNKQHHTLLHRDNEISNSSNKITVEASEETLPNNSATYHSVQDSKQILLSTAVINIPDKVGKLHECRALIDNASQSSFISTALCKVLGIPLRKTNVPVEGVNETLTNINQRAKIALYNSNHSLISPVDCLVVDKVTQNLPLFSFSISNLKLPQNIRLADPKFNISAPVDVLLGADIYWKILRDGFIKGNQNQPPLQKTELGWILGGCLNQNQHHSVTNTKFTCNLSVSLSTINETIERFWQVENISTVIPDSKDYLLCENFYKDTVRREPDGRFVVKLPFNEHKATLGHSRSGALRRFYNLENKLQRDPTLKVEYSNFLREYLSLGHMELVNTKTIVNESFYLPHHAVFKDSVTTKTRVVFDASMKSSTGLSLNDILMTGPNLQQDLFSILCRFRTYKYVMSADIAKMYRQIKVDYPDNNYQLILWRENNNEPLKTYKLLTVTYGTNCAPFLAIKTLHQLAEEEKDVFSEACAIIKRDFYMDDCLTGADSLAKAKLLREQLTEVLARGGFELRKWVTNAPEILENVKNETNAIVNLDGDNVAKILGVFWNSRQDSLEYSIMANHDSKIITKRVVLSTISRIYDPLGLLQPIIVKLKILMQKIWVSKIDWDDNIPPELLIIWNQCLNNLHHINSIKVSRYLIHSNAPDNNIELHGFCDASKDAYGCCVYIRTQDSIGNYHTNLLCAKSRVSPLKVLSIPRLELCGAVLLVQLMSKVKESLHFQITRQYYWTDSTIVLAWLSAPSTNWNTFVSNRVSLIQSISRPEQWHHVSSTNNPADIVSRGSYPNQLITNELWWHGPQYLTYSYEHWPVDQAGIDIQLEDIPEKRKICLHNFEITNSSLHILEKYSSFTKLVRTMALIYRFIHNCRKSSDKRKGLLTVSEIDEASIKIIKLVQLKAFHMEYKQLKENFNVHKNSSLRALNPFLDENDIIRVGGRIQSSNLTYDSKCPIVLPKNSHFTNILISHYHNKQLHPGTQGTLAAIRQKFWILSGRSAVRKVIHKCITCFKNKPRMYSPMMGNLPKERLVPCRPFLKVGIDYAGPIFMRSNLLPRSKTNIKSYICVFVCMVTKAVHLELVTSLSAESFLNMMKRFISRRGNVTDVFSDNASNFRGASRELMEIYRFCQSPEFNFKVIDKLQQDRVNWHFIPPRSPHFGGLWEASVKSIKHHIKRVIGETILNYENMYTLLTMIEAVLNSRPLSPLSEDPNDLEPLTPSHFIIGEPLTAIPEANIQNIPNNRLRTFQHLERMKQHFWKRFSSEYLNQLQQRSKWQQPNVIISPNTLVLLKDNNLPPLQWLKGRIVDVHPGSDNVVRVVSVKLADGSVVKRAVSNVCPLPIGTD